MKTRLTITLSESTLTQIDQLIDRKSIRNRSHAIEHLLEKSLQPIVKSAIILSGGPADATQLRGLTLLNDKPLIFYTLELLKKSGVEDVVIATNTTTGKELEKLLTVATSDISPMTLALQALVRSFSSFTFAFETTPIGTAGAVKQAAALLPEGPFFVIAGDVLTNINLHDLAAFHTQNQALVTMAVKPRPAEKAYDNVFVQGHTVVDFQGSGEHQLVGIVNAGIYLFEPAVLNVIPENTFSMLEQDIFPKLARSRKIIAFPFQGIWFDISTDSKYQDVVATFTT
jgi:NDP-sugar pyrophosphorylase family protein